MESVLPHRPSRHPARSCFALLLVLAGIVGSLWYAAPASAAHDGLALESGLLDTLSDDSGEGGDTPAPLFTGRDSCVAALSGTRFSLRTAGAADLNYVLPFSRAPPVPTR